MSLFQLAAIS